MRGPDPPGSGRLESETAKYGRGSRGTRTLELLRWRALAAILNDRPILSSERMLHEVYNLKCSVEKNTGRGSQGDWRQNELIRGKPPVIK
jgi:hypothetical protein